MLRHIIVGDNELVFVIRKRRLAGVLAAGEYWIFGPGVELERHNLCDLVLHSQWTDTLVRQHGVLAARYFTIVETGDSQAAVVYLDGHVARVVAPAQCVLYFRGTREVTFDLIDVRADPEVPADLVAPLARLGREAHIVIAAIDAGERGFVYVDGRLIRQLGPESTASGAPWESPASTWWMRAARPPAARSPYREAEVGSASRPTLWIRAEFPPRKRTSSATPDLSSWRRAPPKVMKTQWRGRPRGVHACAGERQLAWTAPVTGT